MVHATAVDGLEDGRLRVGMVGGGRNAFIGAVHRMAVRLDDLIELKAGARSLALFVTGLELEAVSADLATSVPGRLLVRRRGAGRARGEPGRGRQISTI